MIVSNAIAVLDANVIYPARLRDFLLRLADSNLFLPKWTIEIQQEWIRNALKRRPNLTMVNLNRTKAVMNAAFPEANVTGHEALIKSLSLPDNNDRHVLAAAIKGEATLIVTNNLKDFPKSKLAPYGIEAISPDEFVQRLITTDKQLVLATLNELIDSLKSPPQSKEQVLNTLEKCGLKNSVHLLK
jgi:hypothetical protein